MGRMLGVFDSRYAQSILDEPYTATIVTTKLATMINPCTVVGISGVTTTQGSGGACTLSFYKAPAGVAIGSGTLLHTGNYNLVGTVDAIQTMVLSITPGVLNLNVGDALGFVLTGTPTSAVGTVQFVLEPT